MTDLMLKNSVLDEFAESHLLHTSGIVVSAANGIVTLTGYVTSNPQKHLAENLARRVPGVQAVVEELEVNLPVANVRADEDLAQAAVNALNWNVLVPDQNIKIKVEDGWITLTGHVPTPFQKRTAEAAVRDLVGVRGIINALTTDAKIDRKAIMQQIESALQRKAHQTAEGIQIEANDGTITLNGTVKSWSDRQDIIRAAKLASGDAEIRDNIAFHA